MPTMLNTTLQKLAFQLRPVHSAIWSVQVPALLLLFSFKHNQLGSIKQELSFCTVHGLFQSQDVL